MSGNPQQWVYCGWQQPVFTGWPAAQPGTIRQVNTQAYTPMNWHVQDYDIISIFRPNSYACQNYQAVSGGLGFLRNDPDIYDGQIVQGLIAYPNPGSNNGTIDPFIINSYIGFPNTDGNYTDGINDPINPRTMSFSAITQLWYYYDDLSISGYRNDSLTPVGTGLHRQFGYNRAARDIWNRHPVRWGFIDNRIDESGNVNNYTSHFGKTLAFPLTEWPSQRIETPNVPSYTGVLNELRYVKYAYGNADTGNFNNINVALTGTYALVEPASDPPMNLDPSGFGEYFNLSVAFQSPGANNSSPIPPLRICNEDAIQISAGGLATAVADAISGWNEMLSTPKYNSFHPSWPWIGNMQLEDINSPNRKVVPFANCWNYQLQNWFAPLNSFNLYSNDYMNLMATQGSSTVGPIYSGIPIPALDPEVSFQLNNLNLKPKGFVTDQGWQTGVTTTYHSGAITTDLVHQLNTVPTFFYNIFAKQKIDYRDYTGQTGSIFYPEILSFSGIRIPEMEWIGAKLYFGAVVPKDISFEINLDATEHLIPTRLTLVAASSDGYDIFGDPKYVNISGIVDGYYVVKPVGDFDIVHIRQDGSWIHCSDRTIYPRNIIGQAQYDSFGNYIQDLKQFKYLPFSTGFTLQANSNYYLVNKQTYTIPPDPIDNSVDSGNPCTNNFYWFTEGVLESGVITNDDSGGSGIGPFFGRSPSIQTAVVGHSTNGLLTQNAQIADNFFQAAPTLISRLDLRTGWQWNSSGLANWAEILGWENNAAILNAHSVGFDIKANTVGSLGVSASIVIDGVDIPMMTIPRGVDLPSGYIFNDQLGRGGILTL